MQIKKKAFLLGAALWMCLLLNGCAGDREAKEDLTCAQIADQVQAAAGFAEMTDANEKYLEKYLMIEADDLDDWVMRRDASRATPEMILVIRVKSTADQSAVKGYVQAYLDEQILQYRDYQPAQLFKLENAAVLDNGPFIALIVSPDAGKTNAALGGGWQ